MNELFVFKSKRAKEILILWRHRSDGLLGEAAGPEAGDLQCFHAFRQGRFVHCVARRRSSGYRGKLLQRYSLNCICQGMTDEEKKQTTGPDEDFSDYWHRKSRRIMQASLVFAMLSAGLLGEFDKLFLKEPTVDFMFWFRVTVSVPGCAIAVAIAFSRWSKQTYLVSAILACVVNSGFAYAYLLEGSWSAPIYLVITSQTFVFLFLLFRVPIRYAGYAGLLVMVVYLVPQFIVHDSNADLALYCMLGLIVGSMVFAVAWAIEAEARRTFTTEQRYQREVREREAHTEVLRTTSRYVGHEVSGLLEIARGALRRQEGKDTRYGLEQSLDGIARIIGTATEFTSLPEAMRNEPKTPCDVATIVQQVLLRDDEKRFDVDLAATATVNGNVERLRQAVNAIVDNALGFSPSHHAVAVVLRATDVEVILSISNHGPPPAEPTAKLFDPWTSSRASGAGSSHQGLGLYIANAGRAGTWRANRRDARIGYHHVCDHITEARAQRDGKRTLVWNNNIIARASHPTEFLVLILYKPRIGRWTRTHSTSP